MLCVQKEKYCSCVLLVPSKSFSYSSSPPPFILSFLLWPIVLGGRGNSRRRRGQKRKKKKRLFYMSSKKCVTNSNKVRYIIMSRGHPHCYTGFAKALLLYYCCNSNKTRMALALYHSCVKVLKQWWWGLVLNYFCCFLSFLEMPTPKFS